MSALYSWAWWLMPVPWIEKVARPASGPSSASTRRTWSHGLTAANFRCAARLRSSTDAFRTCGASDRLRVSP
jgi:hypothetical protein